MCIRDRFSVRAPIRPRRAHGVPRPRRRRRIPRRGMVPRRSRERRARRLRPRSRLRLRPPPGVETRRLEEPSKPSRRRREPAAARGRRAARRPRRVQVANQIRGAPRGDGGDERPRRAEAGSRSRSRSRSLSLLSLLAADAERDARGRGRGRRRRVRDYLLESSLEKHSSAGVLPPGRTQGLIPRRAALRAPRVGGGDERGFCLLYTSDAADE